ncbi:MAG: PTS transporter subunit EIIA, partial [Aliifodinibius sp.]|nr:PTS transporter subunit EIIA [candidate division Zixibacteria bacterium]NIT61134.1 PTS transporter subunit EIIA [Fodinibius sp.]NIS48590.1 PTS transporter subunit EIIA [candidate division Zixibacteria bacterium]NIU13125.1 PTS transporter subunit EIIA [candidate division Zixibacteria bacterium]NIV08829.1 PTS transporter subunit EIIA [candidate division Zixibacteria bacterium]
MHLVELLNDNLIELNLNSQDKFEVIENLLDVAVKNGKILDRGKALQDLIEREQYLSTGFENGLA